MGIFDIFKGRKDGSRAIAAEMKRKKEIFELLYDCQNNFDLIKNGFEAVRTDILKATDVAIERREELFEGVKAETIQRLTELKTQVDGYVEKFKKEAEPADTIKMMKISDAVGKEIEKMNTVTLANGPTGPAGPQ